MHILILAGNVSPWTSLRRVLQLRQRYISTIRWLHVRDKKWHHSTHHGIWRAYHLSINKLPMYMESLRAMKMSIRLRVIDLVVLERPRYVATQSAVLTIVIICDNNSVCRNSDKVTNRSLESLLSSRPKETDVLSGILQCRYCIILQVALLTLMLMDVIRYQIICDSS